MTTTTLPQPRRSTPRRLLVGALRLANERINKPRYLDIPSEARAVVRSAPTSTVDTSQATTTVFVLHASQTGNAEYIAGMLTESLTDAGVAAVSADLGSLSLAELSALRHIAVVCSTTGEGDFPSTAMTLADELTAAASGFDAQTGFTVLALGDRTYEHFCGAGRTLDERLADLGATRLAPLRECDVDFDEDAAEWIDTVTGTMFERLGHGNAADVPPSRPGKLAKRVWHTATVLDNRLLSGPASTKEVRHLTLGVDPDQLSYRPGDSIALLPHNDPTLVDLLATRLGLADDSVDAAGNRFVELISSEREIVHPTRKLVDHVAQTLEGAGTDCAQLRTILAGEGDLTDALDGLDVLDLLELDNEIAWDAEDVVERLGILQPRVYSISSTSAVDPSRIDLTVSVERWERADRRRGGVCTTFLADRVDVGTQVRARMVPNPAFGLPTDESPLIMVGPGTGIAPFRAFLSELDGRTATPRTWLFFGDRTRADDFLYEADLTAWQERGTLTNLDLAFSRDGDKRCYVQDLMAENGAELFGWLEDGARVFICGDKSRMAADVEATLLGIIATHSGGDANSAATYLSELKKQGRYVLDVY